MYVRIQRMYIHTYTYLIIIHYIRIPMCIHICTTRTHVYIQTMHTQVMYTHTCMYTDVIYDAHTEYCSDAILACTCIHIHVCIRMSYMMHTRNTVVMQCPVWQYAVVMHTHSLTGREVVNHHSCTGCHHLPQPCSTAYRNRAAS